MCILNFAAIRIQSLVRGGIVRQLGSRNWRARILRRPGKVQTSQLDKYLSCLDRYQASRKFKPEWLENGFSAWCCVRVQCWWRMTVSRRRYLRQCRATCHIAAIVLQDAVRKYLEHLEQLRFDAMPVYSPNKAASMIQLRWRSFCNRRIYFYFRDLVLFKLKGAPEDLLRSIVPEECNAMDRAAGVHARFRLGGRVFPPRIFFKVFTHKPVCDVNAFAPRDYTVESKIESFQTNNKKVKAKKTDLTSYGMNETKNIRVGASYFGAVVSTNNTTGKGWYRRIENNPWRPISKDLVEELTMDEHEREKLHEKPPEPFHFSRLRRRQDVERVRKERRREWMRKAYLLTRKEDGAARVEAFGSLGSSQVFNQGHGSIKLPPINKPNAGNVGGSVESSILKGFGTEGDSITYQQSSYIAQDDPITPTYGHEDMKTEEDLLRWSMALDFEDYTRDWAALATSLPSDVTYAESVSASRVDLVPSVALR